MNAYQPKFGGQPQYGSQDYGYGNMNTYQPRFSRQDNWNYSSQNGSYGYIYEDPILKAQRLVTTLIFEINSQIKYKIQSSAAETLTNIEMIPASTLERDVFNKIQEIIYNLKSSSAGQLVIKTREQQEILYQIPTQREEAKKREKMAQDLSQELTEAKSLFCKAEAFLTSKTTRKPEEIQRELEMVGLNLSLETSRLKTLESRSKDLDTEIDTLVNQLAQGPEMKNILNSLSSFQLQKIQEAQRKQQITECEKKKSEILSKKSESMNKLKEVNLKISQNLIEIDNLESNISLLSSKKRESIEKSETTIGFITISVWSNPDEIQKKIDVKKKQLNLRKIEKNQLEHEIKDISAKIKGFNIEYLSLSGNNYFQFEQQFDAYYLLKYFNSLKWTFHKETNTYFTQKDGINFLWNNELNFLECPSTFNGHIYFDSANKNYNLRPLNVLPKSPWVISKNLSDQIQPSSSEVPYTKILLNSSHPEYEFVHRCFNQSKPPYMRIKHIYFLHNPNLTNLFVSELSILEHRAKIKPKLQENDSQYMERIKALKKWEDITKPFYPVEMYSSDKIETLFDTRILPLWHGSSFAKCESIATSGFQFFGNHHFFKEQAQPGPITSTDEGYFGNGIYFTTSAQCASLYSDGKNILLSWVSMTQPYPVVSDIPNPSRRNYCKDMDMLRARQHYQNYNAHYIPVKSAQPNRHNCVEYFPCNSIEEAAWDEIVVFQHSQTLPRFWIELEPDLY